MRLIQPSDRFFVAGARGMAGSAIVRALKRMAMAIRAGRRATHPKPAGAQSAR